MIFEVILFLTFVKVMTYSMIYHYLILLHFCDALLGMTTKLS